ncbi:hypothetical protein [Pseudidiomarina sediminum]|uniref:hypothetical protein n=1 Tax=Pseudidiomarina sediminum TaxID=431675 RepID=UPI001C939A09|nr:hypothetical protein [Pseudidiomarina sediminum]MBY6064164.1 hypothetical protein [Pseudidiomarina sediminum]
MKQITLACVVGAAVVSSTTAYADWDTDPKVYLEVSPSADGKSVVDSYGNLIVGYSDGLASYDFYLQKYDRHGNPLWDGEAKLVRERNQSYNLIWSMVIDATNAVYVGLGDEWKSEVFVQKVLPDGSKAWAEDFVPTPDDLLQAYTVDLATKDDHLAYSLTYFDTDFNQVLDIGYVDGDGELLWNNKLHSTQMYAMPVDITTVSDGVVVMFAAPRESDNAMALYLQKYDFAGNTLWGDEPLLVLHGKDTLPPRGQPQVKLYHDGVGGVAFAWRQPIGLDAKVSFQHYDADGKALFPYQPLRVSSGSDFEYSNANNPTLVVTEQSFDVAWVARGDQGPLYDYAIHFQRVSREGELLLGSEPAELVTIEPEDHYEDDVGLFDGGFLSRTGDQYSILYSYDLDYTSLDTELRRVDFTPEGEVIRNVTVVDADKSIGYVSPNRSLFGETVVSFYVPFSSLSGLTGAQSINNEGAIGINTGLQLEYPSGPWFEREDTEFKQVLHFTDTVDSSYEITVDSSLPGVEAGIQALKSQQFMLAVTPEAEFHGVVPVTVTLLDSHDPTRSISMEYAITYLPVNDPPQVTLASNQLQVSEDETVSVAAQISDVDNEALAIEWTQTAGESIAFHGTADGLTLDTPVLLEDQAYVFTLTVSDGEHTVTEQLDLHVVADKSPTVSAASLTLQEASTGALQAITSAAKQPLTIAWEQVSGPQLTLSATDQLSINVTAPYVESSATAQLEITIVDANGESASATVSVQITQPESESSSGSFGIFGLFLALAFLVKRRHTNANRI